MSERYGKLFSSPENLYTEGSPVILAAGALLKDNQTGKVLAQLKFQSISPRKIKALTVCIQPLDTVGNPLGDTVAYQYLDLCADRDSEFGQKVPISLPDAASRSFTVSVTEVIFTDNTTWIAENHPWESLKNPQLLSSLRDSELEKQFRLDYGLDCGNLLLEQKELWHCVCGSINQQGEDKCHKCDRAYAVLKAIDMDSLRAKKEERLAKEKADAEVAQRKAQEQAKTFKKNAMRVGIIAACIAVVVIAVMLISDLVAYNSAVALMESGQYKEAIAAFEAMDGYRDSAEQIIACETAITDAKYQDAIALIESEQYEKAIAEFEMLGAYKDSEEKKAEAAYLQEQVKLETAYQEAVALKENGEKANAAIVFGKLGDYRDSNVQSTGLWDEIAGWQTISAGRNHTVGLKSDGTVVAVGSNGYGQHAVSDWSNIVAISAGFDHTVGLKSDGTAVAVGSNKFGQCDVSDWTDIVAISAGWYYTVGLKSDGTVVAVGSNADGQCNVSDWTDIVTISAGGFHTIGLKSDGTVVAVGNNEVGQCDVYKWSDIVAISAGQGHTVGLKSDGTVVAVGYNEHGQCNTSYWTNIVAISAGDHHTVGLKSDGTVVAAGYNYYGQCDVSEWSDIVAISAGVCYTVGLKLDGTVVAVGYNDDEQCNVSSWNNIRIPG